MNYEEINNYLEQIRPFKMCRAEGKAKDLWRAQLRPIAIGALKTINADYPELIPAYKVWLDFAEVGLRICEFAVSTVERILRIKYDPQFMECGIDTVFEDKGIVCFVNIGNNEISSEQLLALQEALGWPSVFTLEPSCRNGQNGLKFKFDVLSSRCLAIYDACRQCGLTDEITQDS